MRQIKCDRCGTRSDDPPKEGVPERWGTITRNPTPYHLANREKFYGTLELCPDCLISFRCWVEGQAIGATR